MKFRTQDLPQRGLRIRDVRIRDDVPYAEVGVAGSRRRRRRSEAAVRVSMLRRGRQVLIEVSVTRGNIGNRELRESALAEDGVVLYLRRAIVVESIVGERRWR